MPRAVHRSVALAVVEVIGESRPRPHVGEGGTPAERLGRGHERPVQEWTHATDTRGRTVSTRFGSAVTIETDGPRLVIAVARLGEADLAGWWRSHGLDAVGEYVLPDLFPRTAVVAGAELAVLSAAKRHADALPERDDVVHLFGEPLPAFAAALALLAELKTGGDRSFVDEVRGWARRDDGHQALAGLTGAAPPSERIGNTLRLGKLQANALTDPELAESAARTLAAAYVSQGPDLAVPYYDLA